MSFDQEIQNGKLELFNTQGQKVRIIENIIGTEFKLNKGNLSAGVYMLNLSQDNGVIYSGKVIVVD